MALPKQVAEADARADELLKQEAGTPAPEETDEGEKAPAAETEATDDTQESTPESQAQQEDATEAEEDATDYKHKFEVLQGKYNSEMKRLNDQLREQRAFNQQLITSQTELSNTVKDLRASLEKGPAAEKAPETAPQDDFDVKKVLTQEDLDHLEAEDLDGKTLEIFTKLIRAGSKPEPVKSDGKMEERISTIEKTVKETAKQTWEDRIVSEIPDFREINEDTRFHEWLEMPVSSYSLQTRGQALQEAINKQDLKTLKAGIDAFRRKINRKTSDSQTPEKAKTPDLDAQVEPQQGAASDNQPVGGRVYTMDEVKKFYLDQTKGLWEGRESEAAAIDKDITLAQAEGRIRP